MPKVAKPLFELYPQVKELWDFAKNPSGTEHKARAGKFWWLCKELKHSFSMSILAVARGAKCPVCANRSALPGFNSLKDTHPELIAEWSPLNALKPFEVTARSSVSVLWRCSKGHCWRAFVYTRANGSGCLQCYKSPGPGSRICDLPEDILVDVADSNPPELLATIFIGSMNEISWRGAKCGHEWSQAVALRLRGARCPVCVGRELRAGVNDAETAYPALKSDWSKLNPPMSTVSRSSGIKYLWICAKCSAEDEQAFRNRLRSGCKRCNRGSSRLEEIVLKHLNDLGVKLSRRQRAIKSPKGRLELDFILAEQGVAIEVQDFTTHSRSSDRESGHPWSSSGFKNGPTYHANKARLTKEQLNLELIELWEDQILDGSFKSILKKRLSDSEATPKQNQH